jgi:hypothetical protein
LLQQRIDVNWRGWRRSHIGWRGSRCGDRRNRLVDLNTGLNIIHIFLKKKN